MNGLLTIASLTIKEAVRRKVPIVSLLISLIFAFWIFVPLHLGPRAAEGAGDSVDGAGKVVAWMLCGTIKFFSSVLAITLASGAISSELDKGVLSVIVSKPLSRTAIYFGKWLGLIAILGANVAIWGGLLILVVWKQTHSFHPHILTGILATFLFPVLFATVTLWFSTFAASPLAAGLSFITAGIALAQDIILSLATAFNSPVLKDVSIGVGYLVPINKMNEWITRGLGDAGIDLSSFNFNGTPPVTATIGDLVYILCYIVGALILGAFIFQKRDL